MFFDLNDFFDSLRHDRFDIDNPVIPAGLVDLSRVIDLIIDVMRDGRMLWSDQQYAFADCTVDRLERLFGDRSTQHGDADAVVALFIVLSLVLQTSARMPGHVAPEELLMEALDETVLFRLRGEFRTTPTVFTTEGRLRPNFCSLSPFHEICSITGVMLHGFMKRHLTPHLPDLFLPPGERRPRSSGSQGEDFVISDSLPEKTISDRCQGFGEFHDHFDLTDYADYEDGEDVEGA